MGFERVLSFQGDKGVDVSKFGGAGALTTGIFKTHYGECVEVLDTI